MLGLSGKELLLILVVVLLLFGSSKIPSLARSLGKSINEFKKGRAEGAKEEDQEQPTPPTSPNKHA